MTRSRVARGAAFIVGLFVTLPVFAQEGPLAAEFRREREAIKEDCRAFDPERLISCGETLLTGKPVHIALGSIAPQNGFGFGVALGTSHAPSEDWRVGWSADIVGAPGGAWRAGTYIKIIHTAVEAPVPVAGPGTVSESSGAIHPYPVIDAYAQVISLPTLSYYGLGPDTSRDARAIFGMGQTIVGSSAIVPITWRSLRTINLSLLGEVNGRFVDLRSAPGEDAPSIEQIYSNATAPGLDAQPGFVQFGEGVRIQPSLVNDRVRLNYLAQLQQFVAASGDTYSFRRWTLDLDHEFPVYHRSTRTGPRETNTPDDCAMGPASPACPPISWSRNRTGTVGVRLLMSKSQVSGQSVVPFYLQPTLGGSDINGQRILPSYDDYRFRGSNVLVLQESLEHSLYGPIGLWLAADQGRVGPGDDGDFGEWKQSFTAGLTIRAGGIPAVVLSWATGGSEGSHVALTMSTTLLGGSARPSLY